MERKKTLRRGLLAVLACAALGGALMSPPAALADGGSQGKGKKIPIIIQDPIITPDPQPTPPPKKK